MANNGNSKTVTIVSINRPYRNEAPYTFIRLARAAKEKGININFFNYLDGTIIGHRDHGPKEFPVVEQLFGTVLKKGLKNSKTDAIACIKCTDARGVTKQHIVTQPPYGKEDAYSAIPLAEMQATAGNSLRSLL